MPGPFLAPQQIFDFSSIALAGATSPNAIQDSGTIAIAVGPGWTQVFAAVAGNTLWCNILQVSAPAGANLIQLATGPAGFEIVLFDMAVPPQAVDFGWTLFRGPFTFAPGVRISMRASALVSQIETHFMYRI